MALAYTFDGANDQPGMGSELHAEYAVARKWYDQVQKWTGFDLDQIFNGPAVAREGGFRWDMGPVRQAAAGIATCDVLAEYGLRPALACGLSLGALIASCVAGAVDRRELIELFVQMRDAPAATGEPQGMAIVVLRTDDDVNGYLREGLYLVGEGGSIGAGDVELYVLGGYRSAIDELSAELPPGMVRVFDEIPVARHTPLFQYMADYMEPYVAAMTFGDPQIPLVACMEPKTLTTAEEVRDVFHRHNVAPLHLPYLGAAVAAHAAELSLVIGPSRVSKHQRSPVPVVHVETPEHVLEAVTAVHELGIVLSAAEGAR